MAHLNGKIWATFCMVLVLSACGGGGGDDAPSPQPQTNPPPTQPTPPTNAAPVIQGQPGTAVTVGETYSFQASASDSNGDTLTFSATNLPAWMSINAGTGRLTGTPGVGDVGSYAGITIRVSDGQASASLAPFTVTVAAVAMGNATLSWTAPTQNTDGSALTNLSGYRIRYGRSATDMGQSVSITNPSISRYVVENLGSGAWFFAVVAVNSAGVESALSNIATKTIG